MKHEEIIKLIREGVQHGLRWADIGAGGGNFTRALADLLHDDAVIYALDQNTKALRALEKQWSHPQQLITISADLRQQIPLQNFGGVLLDGAVMANVLHFIPHQLQANVLQKLMHLLNQDGGLIVIEYDVRNRRPWIPYPVPFAHLSQLAEAHHYSIKKLGERRSPSSGITMISSLLRA